MKLFFKSLLLFCCVSAFAQDNKHCGFNYAQERLFAEDPAARERVKKLTEAPTVSAKTSAVAAYTIPVVFHVLHKGGSENISDAQIKSAIAILNRDFQKLNSDTANIVTQFKNLAADCSIQFSLATLDEFGNCTNGITRHYDARTNWTVTSTSYFTTWDPSKYLNIYVVKTLPNGAAAYTYLPGSTFAQMDAIVSLHGYVGNTGTSNNFNARTLTHEVGHWLNLQHVWGSNNNPGVACGDDGVSDTPVTKGHTSCNLGNAITCTSGITENIQNYMEYSYCTCMFTQGQKTRMHNALNSFTGGRNNLSTYSNLVATGVINPVANCAPKAEFIASNSVTCVGNSVSFTDLSYNAQVTSWKWSSPLAAATSTLQNGTLTFTAAGLAPIQLVASNANGSDSIIKSLVTVMAGAGSGTTNLMEGFETDPFPSANWVKTTPLYGSSFSVTSNAAATGSNSIWVNNYYDNPSGTVAVFSPAYNLLNTVSAFLSFKYAYAQQSTMNDDNLRVSISTNCGATWITLFTKSGAALNTTGTLVTSSYLNPQASHWSTQTINVTSYQGSQVYLKFEFTPDPSSPGNNIFIDDINISQIVDVKEQQGLLGIAVYPNPFTHSVIIDNTSGIMLTSAKLYDVSMRRIMQVETGSDKQIVLDALQGLNSGVYFLEIKGVQGTKTIKLIKL